MKSNVDADAELLVNSSPDGLFWSAEARLLQESPKPAIDAFVNLFHDEIDILHRAHQVILRKKKEKKQKGR